MAAKAPGSESNMQRIDAEIAELKQELGRDAEKVAGIRRHRRIRTILSAVVGAALFGTPTFIVYSEAGFFATLVGAFVGFGVMQLYFLIVPSQFAIGFIVRRHRRAEEELSQLLDERRRRIHKALSVTRAREEPCSPKREKRRKSKRCRKR